MRQLHTTRLPSLLGFFLLPFLTLPAGAARAGTAATPNMSVVYGIVAALSLVLFIGYCALIRQKNLWMLLVFLSVFLVNLGYFSLAVSQTLSEALLANRLSYLGSVFLPLCMFMVILEACRLRRHKWLLPLLLSISIAMFLVAASPGFLTCYYREVTLVYVNGMAMLEKVYGPLHPLYLVYLLGYLGLMIGAILTAYRRKKAVSCKHAVLLLMVVCLNMAIWAVEQLIYWEFELLAVSYLVSELLLLVLYSMMQDYETLMATKHEDLPPEEAMDNFPARGFSPQQIEAILTGWAPVAELTAREQDVLRAILADKKRKEIAAELYVTEHTVKKHTANIFSKLEVSSRAELYARVQEDTHE
ncbi:MAG: hypothetical protein IKB65_05050 [Ruminiclostridium sp.]|nr:hypothetical protein [Ruminiclostridium sp.]